MAKSTNYLSGKEIRQIAKENNKVMKRLEAYKYRKCDESEYLTEMKDNRNILEIEELHTYFFTEQGVVKAVNGVSLDIPRNATVGIVGESGCGKSVTSMSVMRLCRVLPVRSIPARSASTQRTRTDRRKTTTLQKCLSATSIRSAETR